MSLKTTDGYPAPGRRLRLGIVGGGRGALVGQWHAAGSRLSNRWELIAGALSSDPEVAIASGRDWMFAEDRIYTDFHAMAARESQREDGIEAVAVCTPNNMHREVAETFMRAGIDIICDKPLANTIEDCEALAAVQRDTGLVFAVTHPYTYHPMVRQARDMITAGAIGELRQFQIEYAQDWATRPPDPDSKPLTWRRNPAIVGRTATTGDIGTHALHMLEFVASQRATKLRADFHVCGAPNPMEDTAFLQLKLENGAPGAMWVSQAAAGNDCALRFRIFGTEAGLEWDQEDPERLHFNRINAPKQIIVRGHEAGVLPGPQRMLTLPRGHGESLTDAWANLYREIAILVQARREGRSADEDDLIVPDLADGLRGVQFIHAAADSHDAGGRWTELPADLTGPSKSGPDDLSLTAGPVVQKRPAPIRNRSLALISLVGAVASLTHPLRARAALIQHRIISLLRLSIVDDRIRSRDRWSVCRKAFGRWRRQERAATTDTRQCDQSYHQCEFHLHPSLAETRRPS